MARVKPLEDVAAEAPEQLLPREARRRLERVSRQLDNLARVEEATGELKIHEPTLRRLLRDEELFGSGFEQRAFDELERSDATRILVRDEHGKRKVRWHEFVDQIGLPEPPPANWKEELGIDDSSTEADVRDALRARLTDVPPDAFEGDKLARRLEEVTGRRRTREATSETAVLEDLALWWDCVRRKLGGWWFWILFGALVAFAAALPAVWVGVALAGAWLGFWALAIAITCAFNPFS